MFPSDRPRPAMRIIQRSMSSLASLPSLDLSKYFSRPPQTQYSHISFASSPDLERSPRSSSSSSPTSPSRPLLHQNYSPNEKTTRPKKKESAAFKIHRIRTLTIRILCGCVVFAVITMVFALSGMKNHTMAVVEKHLDSPAIWESFIRLKSYYNGLYELVPRSENVPENTGPMNVPKAGKAVAKLFRRAKSKGKKKSKGKNKPKPKPRPLPPTFTYDPYPDYQSNVYTQQWKGEHVDCSSLMVGIIPESLEMKVYKGVPRGMPDEYYGSYELLGIDNDICFERRTRLGIYGHKDRDEIPQNATDEGLQYDLEWKGFDWAKIQKQCVEMNKHRYAELPELNRKQVRRSAAQEQNSAKKVHARTALVLRLWHSYEWKRSDYVNLRSLITELNIKSGGEYDVRLLVHVQDEDIPIWSKDSEYERVLRESIIEEFQGLAMLWNEKMMSAWYPKLGGTWRGLSAHGAYRSLWMPMQYFARKHPEYDYFWNLDLDVRYIGHWYHFLEKATEFARKQPRRGLWERNSRFYVPSVHGSWSQFTDMVNKEANPSESIWGPLAIQGVNLTHRTPTPPFEKPEEDEGYTWGVDEEADLITFNPIFDPKNTTWALRDDFIGYGQERPDDADTNPYWTGPERRASVVAFYRFSRRLLDVMHDENTHQGHTMCSEQWPATVALHHGLKAVYVPHPTFMDRRWPGKYLASVLNNGKFGTSGGRQRSIFGDREHHFAGSSFYYGSYWPGALYKMWLGWRWSDMGGEEWEEEHGRMCLPQMLLHPVKDL
ncbi:hypothetical protein ABW19_dt0206726 [Dactylella cylindrospora]|nr:hypothetical protein ABW19_dt0206726 [Dactylella cylindrospora]